MIGLDILQWTVWHTILRLRFDVVPGERGLPTHLILYFSNQPMEIALDGNDTLGNGGDGVRFDREVLDACLTGNRIRRNGGEAVALGAPMPGLWREGNREEWSTPR